VINFWTRLPNKNIILLTISNVSVCISISMQNKAEESTDQFFSCVYCNISGEINMSRDRVDHEGDRVSVLYC
jgi:hypothetical protein